MARQKKFPVRLVGDVPVLYDGEKVGTAFIARGDVVNIVVEDPKVVDKLQPRLGDFSICFTSNDKKGDDDGCN